MSLKIKFLIISLEVLTIFVKMVPAFSRVIGIQKPIQTTIPSDENQIHCNTLIKITDLCQTKIEAYSKPFEFETANSSAALLYIKDTLYRYNTYHYPIEHISANLLTQYYLGNLLPNKVDTQNFVMLMQNNDAESDLKDEFARFKRIKEQDLRSQYEVVTSCRLNEKIIAEIYFWEYFKVVYYLTKAQHILKGNSRFPVEELMNTLETKQAIVEDNETLDFQFTSDTYLKFIELYKEELNLQFSNGETLETHIILMTRNFDTQDPNVVKARQYLIDQYHIFTRIWELYQFNLHLFLTYKILDKKIPAEKTTGLTPFLEHFKESLDYNYYIHTGMNIAMLSEDRQIMYYYNTLRTLRIIVTSYYSEQPNTFKVYDEDHKDSDLIGIAPDDMETFVSLLTYVAKDIKNTDNFKQMPHQLKEKYLEKMDVCSKNQNDLITIENSYYKCDDSECTSELPSTVNIKDVLNYVIANIESIYFRFKTQKDSEEASTNQRPITGRGGDRHDLRKHDY